MRQLPHVALLIETSRSYGRGLLKGIERYQLQHGPWSVYFQPHDLSAPVPRWLRWKGNGILARIEDRQTAKLVQGTGLPTIDLRFAVLDIEFPRVGIENRAVVKLAFEHLRNAGFREFGFCGIPHGHSIWMDLRMELFGEMVEKAGHPCHIYHEAKGYDDRDWERQQEHLAAWLAKLPKPIGLMANNDDRGQQVLDACRRAKLHVPDEVGVIGVDNDELLCNLSSPPLSSVDIDTERVGYEAAARLGRMMKGSWRPKEELLLPPRGVVARASTDVLASEDRELVGAIRYLREHACEGLRLKSFLRHTTLTRRTLERRVFQLLGRSPKDEITRIRIEKAKLLLADATMPIYLISEQCGYSQPRYFCKVFHAEVGVSPSEYRRESNVPADM